MKRNNEEWTDAVRRALDGAEPPLPRDGWERLEKELEDAVLPAFVVPSRKVWLKFAAAAAAVLVCVSIGFRVFRSDRNVLKRVVIVQGAAVSGQNTDAGEQTLSASGDLAALREALGFPQERDFAERIPGSEQTVRSGRDAEFAAARDPKQDTPAGSSEFSGLTITQRSLETAAEQPPGNVMPESVVELQSGTDAPKPVADALSGNDMPEKVVRPQETASGERDSELRYKTADYDGLFASAEPRRRNGSVSLSAGGIVTSAGGGTGGDYSSMLMSDEGPMIRNAYRDFSYSHKQPLSFGVTFRKELGYGLSAESGVVYTLLRSDVAVPGNPRDLRQKLHMIGIPLRVNWEFLRRGRFSLYLGAGAQVEKCVSACFGSERVKEKGVQWSFFGAAGAQYRLGKTVGIYFEPSVSHYLTETMLRTSYTDSSVNLNLQLGVRFTY